LIDNLPNGIFLKDREYRFLVANQITAELMQVPEPTALVGKTDYDFYPREIADALRAEEKLLFETHRSLVNKEELRSLPLGLRRILITKVAITDAKGHVTGLLGITRDITESHETEEKLHSNQQRYRDLLEQAVDGVFLLDSAGNFLVSNASLCEMLGYTSNELLRLNILDTYPKDLRDVGKVRLDSISSGEKLRFEH